MGRRLGFDRSIEAKKQSAIRSSKSSSTERCIQLGEERQAAAIYQRAVHWTLDDAQSGMKFRLELTLKLVVANRRTFFFGR